MAVSDVSWKGVARDFGSGQAMAGALAARKSVGDSIHNALLGIERDEDRQIAADARKHALDREALMDKRWQNAEDERKAEKQLALAEKLANNEATRAVLDADRFKADKLAGERSAIEQSISALPLEEQAAARQAVGSGYKPEQSAAGWITAALGGSNVDQSKVFSNQTSLYNRNVATPGTAEHTAAKEYERDEFVKKQELLDKYDARKEDRRNAASTKLWERQKEDQESLRQKLIKENQDKDTKAVNTFESMLGVGLNNNKQVVTNTKDINSAKVASQGFDAVVAEELTKQEGKINSLTNAYDTLDTRIDTIRNNPTMPSATKDMLISKMEATKEADKAKIKADIDSIFENAYSKAKAAGGTDATVALPKERYGNVLVPKTENEYRLELLNTAKKNGNVTAADINNINTLVDKAYPKLTEAEKKKLKEDQDKISGYKSYLKINDPNTDYSKVNDLITLEKTVDDVQNKKQYYDKNGTGWKAGYDSSEKAILDMMDRYGSPDILGTGDERDIIENILRYAGDAKAKDKDVTAIIKRNMDAYGSGFLLGVDEDQFVTNVKAEIDALKSSK